MPLKLSPLVHAVLGLSADSFPRMAASRFGAQQDMNRTWKTFRPVATTLVDTFYATLDDPRPAQLARRLAAVAPELRGVAYEGAGMGLALLDGVTPGGSRVARFVHGHGAPYRSLVYIGAGLVLPRMPRSTRRYLHRVDPFHRWFVMDGYGFYEGFFAWSSTVGQQRRGTKLPGYASRAYDQGLGRSLWFSTGANVARIIDTVAGFDAQRQPDLWSGLGLACAYAAGVMDRDAITTLVQAAGPSAADLATGAAVAATFRAQTGQPAPHTDLACDVIWQCSSQEVADIAHRADLGRSAPVHAGSYAEWRHALRASWLTRRDAEPDTPGSRRIAELPSARRLAEPHVSGAAPATAGGHHR